MHPITRVSAFNVEEPETFDLNPGMYQFTIEAVDDWGARTSYDLVYQIVVWCFFN